MAVPYSALVVHGASLALEVAHVAVLPPRISAFLAFNTMARILANGSIGHVVVEHGDAAILRRRELIRIGGMPIIFTPLAQVLSPVQIAIPGHVEAATNTLAQNAATPMREISPLGARVVVRVLKRVVRCSLPDSTVSRSAKHLATPTPWKVSVPDFGVRGVCIAIKTRVVLVEVSEGT